MVPPAVTAWTACIGELNKMLSCPAPSTPAELARVQGSFVSVIQLTKDARALSPSTWQKLVIDLQVPGQLAAACAAAIRSNPRSAASVSTLTAFKRFVDLTNEQERAPGSNAVSVCGRALWLQLHRSGVLQQLPQLMQVAAEDLAAFADGSSSTATAGSSRRSSSGGASGSAFGVRGSSSTSQHEDILRAHVEDLLMCCMGLQDIRSCSSDTRLSIALSCAPGNAQLFDTVVHYIHKQFQQQEQHPQQHQHANGKPVLLQALGRACCLCMVKSTQLVDLQWLDQLQAILLLHSRHFLRSLALMACAGVFAATGTWQFDSNTSSSSRSSRNAASSNTAQATLAYQQVAANRRLLTPPQQQLLQLLGTGDGSAVLFLSGLMVQITVRGELLQVFIAAVIRLSTEAQIFCDRTPERRQIQLLLSSVWLPYAATCSLSEYRAVGTLTAAAVVSTGALCKYVRQQPVSDSEGEDTASEADSQQQQQQTDRSDGEADDAVLPPELLAELLPHAVVVLGRLVGNEGSSSSSNMDRAGVVEYVILLCLLLKHSARLLASAPTTPAAEAVRRGVEGSSALSILHALEAAVRWLAGFVPDPSTHTNKDLDRLDHALVGTAQLHEEFALRVCATVMDTQQPGGDKQLQALACLFNSMMKLSTAYVQYPELAACASTCLLSPGLASVVGIRRLTSAARNGSDEEGSSSSPRGASVSGSVCVVLPLLVVFGHYCLHLVQHLKTELSPVTGASGAFRNDLLADGAEVCIEWLEVPSVAAQLSAAGYQTQEVLQALQQLQAVVEQLEDEDDEQAAAAHTQPAFQQQLAAAGRACSSFAVRGLCNNPSCSNVDGPSESKIVSGSGCICGGCRKARYCCKACQRTHWKAGHKPVCKALAQAAAAAAVVEG